MKNRIIPVSVMLMILIFSGAVNLLAQAPLPGDYRRAVEVISKFLNLTEDQQADFVTILQENHGSIKGLEEDRKVLARELDGLLDSGSYSLEEVGAYTEEIHAIGHLIRDVRAAMKDELKLILDEEQEQKSNDVRRSAVLQPVVSAYQLLELLPPVVRPLQPPVDGVE